VKGPIERRATGVNPEGVLDEAVSAIVIQCG